MSFKKSHLEKKRTTSTTVNKITGNKNPQSKWIWIFIILILTFITFSPSLNYSFTSWDDPLYVTENELIKSLSIENIKNIFSIKNNVALNYHPVTIVSLAIDYHFSKLKPYHYHFTNLIIHLLNTLLVFIFIYRLTKGKLITALFVSLFFGIHPMHVESVAWISERKDVLYTFFFLSALITYLKYLETKKLNYIIFTIFLFILSLLSKAMAVVLPVVLILIDYYNGRKFSWKIIIEKIPFLILSLLIGILAMNIQAEKAIASYETFTLFQRISFGFYGFFNYIFKLFLPLNLSSFYPYPLAGTQVLFPASFYLPAIAGIVLFILTIILYFRKKENMKSIVFGMGFYFITIVFVLQFISVGQVIMADRYSYLSYLGLLFPIGVFLNKYAEKNNTFKKRIVLSILSLSILFIFISRERIKVWENTETLWTDVIEKYPFPPWTIEIAFVGRGKYYAVEKINIDKALADFNTLIEMKTKNPIVFNNLGNIYGSKGQQAEMAGDKIRANEYYSKSIKYYEESLMLDSDNSLTYVNRATAFIYMKNYSLAAIDFNKAFQMNPQNLELLEKRAYSYYMSENWIKAIQDYDKLISIMPDKTYLYQYRGASKLKNKLYQEAIPDLNKTIQLEPKNATAYYYLSICHHHLKNHNVAADNLQKAIQNGYKADPAYKKLLGII